MAKFRATYKQPDLVEIAHEGSTMAWTFHIARDGSGRRHLEGPEGSAMALAHGNLMKQACVFAQSDALHAGRVDY